MNSNNTFTTGQQVTENPPRFGYYGEPTTYTVLEVRGFWVRVQRNGTGLVQTLKSHQLAAIENDEENDVNSNLGITVRYFISNTVIQNNGDGITPADDLAIGIAESLLYGEKGDDVAISDVTTERVSIKDTGTEGGIRVEFTISGRKDRGEVYSDTVHADECSDPYCGHCR